MVNSIKKSVVNVGLRGATLASKFVLIFFIAVFFNPSDLGLYGLITASIGYALYAFGFDFYLYSGREVVGSDKENIGRMIKSQFILYLFSYLFISPLFLFIFYKNFIPWHLAPIIFAIMFFEHISQEFNRLLVSLSAQLWASVLLFVRSGIWCLLVIFVMWLSIDYRKLEVLLTFWLCGSALSCSLGVFLINRHRINTWSSKVDWVWIKKGLYVSFPYFLTTLVLQLVFVFDRYLMEFYFGGDLLGAYVLFISFTLAISTFIDAGVFVFFYPSLINAYKRGNINEFKTEFYKMAKNAVVLLSFMSVMALILIKPLLVLINKTIYLNNVNIFYVLLLAIYFQVIGFIPQYYLYSVGKDKQIIFSNFLSTIIFFPLSYFLLDVFGVLSSSVALAFIFFVSLTVKIIMFAKHFR